MSNLSVWLTPIWLLCVGATVGTVILLVMWGIVAVFSRQLARSIWARVSEGVLLPISYTLVALAVIAVIATPVMPLDRMISSLKRVPYVGPVKFEVTVPADTTDFEVGGVAFRMDELRSYSIESEQDVALNIEVEKGFTEPLIQINGGDLYQWSPGSNLARAFETDVEGIFLTNESDLPTVVKGTFETEIEMPEVHDLKVTAISVVAVYLIYMLICGLAPRASIIATATAKEAVSQPLFVLLTIVGVVALIAYIYIPYNTFGEDVKMLKTSGMTTIKVLAILVALWTASVSVSDEIEGRTALTVLSKPVGRRQFIMGKFMGIVWPILLMFVILGIVFLLTVSYKVVYDARESSKTAPIWQECYLEVVRIVPGLVLAFFEAVVMAAISVAISTRLSMLPNLVICGSIYVLGHLGPLIVKSAAGEIVFVKFIGRLISVMLPVLDHYEIEGAIAGSSTVPPEYLWTTLLYSALYCSAAMLLALIFFEERDLA
ncbi:MAG: ABC transporter permease subunit [Planctomycetales bacterium]|nr:ABC transporter permease subunit [Planctomycetales bacterium]